ncbi:MAG TPA: 2Fe-2S iron-sulfur cluster-binding protein [Alphaproteobacteria bacterium]|nr:2Fe-2S iron-sulfur cluster-binding protein [Alphaproteobacteria bacterium]
MPKIIVTDRDGSTRTIEGETGLSVMENLRDNDFPIAAICGGCCSCATCHVYLEDSWFAKLPERQEDEQDLLEGSGHMKETSRLSCQIEFSDELDGLTLTIAPED